MSVELMRSQISLSWGSRKWNKEYR